MATSGSYQLNGGGWNSTFSWSLVRQDIAGNYSVINWFWYANWAQNITVLSTQSALWVNGGEIWRDPYNTSRYRRGGRQCSGQIIIYHNSDGTKNFSAAGEAAFYTFQINARGAGSWDLPRIPRHATITGSSGDITDEQNPWVSWQNLANANIKVKLELPDFEIWSIPGTVASVGNSSNGRYEWNLSEEVRNSIRESMKNTNSTKLRITIHDDLNGGKYTSKDTVIKIINANPDFSDFVFEDTNQSTVAVTGNNQYFIKGHSNLLAKISTENKASPKKQALMNKYLAVFSGITKTANFSNDNTISIDFGAIKTSTSSTLAISAQDSRGNKTTVIKQVNVIPYFGPIIIARGERKNNFDKETNIHIEGIVSLIQIGNTNKNLVNPISGVKYRYREQGTSSWGSWTNVASVMGENGVIGTQDFKIILDNIKAYEFEVQMSDRIKTSKVGFTVGVGVPIMRIGTDGFIYNNEQPLMPSHVGQVIMSTTLDTPEKVSSIYGGTWIPFGSGRALVGVDKSQSEFNIPKKTGGTKTVSLTKEQLPPHQHSMPARMMVWDAGASSVWNQYTWNNGSIQFGNNYKTTSTGDGQAHSNLPPYITVYAWERTK